MMIAQEYQVGIGGGGGKQVGRRNNRPWRGGGRGGGRGGDGMAEGDRKVTPRSRLDDEDVSMEDGDHQKTNTRFSPYGGGRPKHSQGRPQGRNRRDLDDPMAREAGVSSHGESSWRKITVVHNRKIQKDWLLRSLQNICEVPFIPLEFNTQHPGSVFYVDNQAAGDALASISHRITTPEGSKIGIQSRPCKPFTRFNWNEADLQLIKEIMSRRYDPSNKSLDLGNIANDGDLKEKLKINVGHRQHFEMILKIMAENIPETTTLQLDANRIYSLKSMGELSTKMPNITSLNLSRNALRSEEELRHIKGLKLKVLTLEGNPLCENFSDQSMYISAVRTKFPKVEVLDGHELPPPIHFELEVNTELPPVKPTFFAGVQIEALLVPFLDKFFKVYDSGDRQPLLDVYHDQSCFSLTVPAYLKSMPGHSKNILNHYIRGHLSRNLLMTKDLAIRNKMIKQKKVQIIAFLQDLPATQHNMSSLKIDVSMAQGNLICFTVSGTFKEVAGKSNNETVIAFSRVILATHHPAVNLCIVNDALTLRPATEQQLQALNNPGPTPSTSPVNLPQGMPAPAPGGSSIVPALAQQGIVAATQGLTPPQQEMVAAFMRESGMNAEWSMKCLQENQWNYEESGKVFLNLQSTGKIPPEAFKQA